MQVHQNILKPFIRKHIQTKQMQLIDSIVSSSPTTLTSSFIPLGRGLCVLTIDTM